VRLAAISLLAAALPACAAPRSKPLVDVDASLGVVRDWFVSHDGEPRAILLLSPT